MITGKSAVVLTILIFSVSVASGATYYQTDFEGSDPGWSCYTSGDSVNCDTDRNDHYSSPDESGFAHRDDGVCSPDGGGIRKSFSLSSDPEKLVLDMKLKADGWGSTAIVLQNSTGSYTIYRNYAGGNSYETGWFSKEIDLSGSSRNFDIILGNDDDSSYCNYSDHSWWFWADDLRVKVQNKDPDVSSPDPADGESGVDLHPNTSVKYSDPEGSSGTLTFYNGSGNSFGSCGVQNDTRCEVNYSVASQAGKSYSWYVVAEDSAGGTYSSSTFSFTTDPAPYASDPSPSDGTQDLSLRPEISAKYSDPDGDTGDIAFYTDGGSFIGSCTGLSNDTICSTEYSSASSYSRSYSWYARTYDGNTYTRTPETGYWNFQTKSYGASAPNIGRIDVWFEGNQTVFMSDGTEISLPLEVSNPGSSREVKLSIVDGSGFTSFSDGSDTKTFTLNDNSRDFVLISDPSASREKVTVRAVNQDLGISRDAEVYVEKKSSADASNQSSPNEVPGMALPQLAFIALTSVAYLFQTL